MQLRNFPMDRQSCPLILGSCEWSWLSLANFHLLSFRTQDAYTNKELVYQWQTNSSVNFEPNLALRYLSWICVECLITLSFFFCSQFDLISFRQQNLTFARREGDFSTLQVSFNLQRHTGYFLIQALNESLIFNATMTISLFSSRFMYRASWLSSCHGCRFGFIARQQVTESVSASQLF